MGSPARARPTDVPRDETLELVNDPRKRREYFFSRPRGAAGPHAEVLGISAAKACFQDARHCLFHVRDDPGAYVVLITEDQLSGATRTSATTCSDTVTYHERPRSRGRFVFVDALRGIAALWVVLFHAYEGKHITQVAARLPRWALVFFESGHFGVPIFFVLSGFVIAHSVSRHTVGMSFIVRFAVRRAVRLDPPYWASIVLVIGLGMLSKVVMPAKPYEPLGVGQVLAHLLLRSGNPRLPRD